MQFIFIRWLEDLAKIMMKVASITHLWQIKIYLLTRRIKNRKIEVKPDLFIYLRCPWYYDKQEKISYLAIIYTIQGFFFAPSSIEALIKRFWYRWVIMMKERNHAIEKLIRLNPATIPHTYTNHKFLSLKFVVVVIINDEMTSFSRWYLAQNQLEWSYGEWLVSWRQ